MLCMVRLIIGKRLRGNPLRLDGNEKGYEEGGAGLRQE